VTNPITVTQCCQRSGLSDPMIRKLIREGKLAAVKYESCDRVFVDAASLDAYLSRERQLPSLTGAVPAGRIRATGWPGDPAPGPATGGPIEGAGVLADVGAGAPGRDSPEPHPAGVWTPRLDPPPPIRGGGGCPRCPKQHLQAF